MDEEQETKDVKQMHTSELVGGMAAYCIAYANYLCGNGLKPTNSQRAVAEAVAQELDRRVPRQ